MERRFSTFSSSSSSSFCYIVIITAAMRTKTNRINSRLLMHFLRAFFCLIDSKSSFALHLTRARNIYDASHYMFRVKEVCHRAGGESHAMIKPLIGQFSDWTRRSLHRPLYLWMDSDRTVQWTWSAIESIHISLVPSPFRVYISSQCAVACVGAQKKSQIKSFS